MPRGRASASCPPWRCPGRGVDEPAPDPSLHCCLLPGDQITAKNAGHICLEIEFNLDCEKMNAWFREAALELMEPLQDMFEEVKADLQIAMGPMKEKLENVMEMVDDVKGKVEQITSWGRRRQLLMDDGKIDDWAQRRQLLMEEAVASQPGTENPHPFPRFTRANLRRKLAEHTELEDIMNTMHDYGFMALGRTARDTIEAHMVRRHMQVRRCSHAHRVTGGKLKGSSA